MNHKCERRIKCSEGGGPTVFMARTTRVSRATSAADIHDARTCYGRLPQPSSSQAGYEPAAGPLGGLCRTIVELDRNSEEIQSVQTSVGATKDRNSSSRKGGHARGNRRVGGPIVG